MENYIKILGLASAALTTTSFLPQAIKTWQTRSTEDLSPLMFTLFCVGVCGWLFYGILIRDLPMILANSVTIILAGSIMYFIITSKINSRVHHIGIYVEDIDGMAAFYEKWFSARIGEFYHNEKKGFSSRFLEVGTGSKIEIMRVDKGKMTNGDTHIAISLGNKADVDRITHEMKEAGIKIIDGPRTTGDGYYESKIEDPEGNVVELTE